MAKKSVIIEEEPEVVLEPEIASQIEVYRQVVTQLEEQSKGITITDRAGEGAALIFIAGAKKIVGDIEAYRDGLVRPHNNKVRKVNESIKPIGSLAEALAEAMDAKRSAFLLEEQRQIDERNRLAAAEAERLRLEKEAKEKALRDEAERLQREAEELERKRIQKEIDDEIARQAAIKKQRDDEAAAAAAKQKAIDDALAAERAKKDAEVAAEKARIAKEEGNKKAAAAAQQAAEEAKRLQEEADRQARQARADEEAQQRKLEEAQQEELKRMAKAEEDRKTMAAQQLQLEKGANKAEARADVVAEQGLCIAPEIHSNDLTQTRTLNGGGRVGTKEVADVYMESGYGIYEDPSAKTKKVIEYHRGDREIPKGLLDPQFDRYWTLDTAAIVRDVRNGNPVPGFATINRMKTVGRR